MWQRLSSTWQLGLLPTKPAFTTWSTWLLTWSQRLYIRVQSNLWYWNTNSCYVLLVNLFWARLERSWLQGHSSIKAIALTNTWTNHWFLRTTFDVIADRFISRTIKIALCVILSSVIERCCILFSESLQLSKTWWFWNKGAVIHLGVVAIVLKWIKPLFWVDWLNNYISALGGSIFTECFVLGLRQRMLFRQVNLLNLGRWRQMPTLEGLHAVVQIIFLLLGLS